MFWPVAMFSPSFLFQEYFEIFALKSGSRRPAVHSVILFMSPFQSALYQVPRCSHDVCWDFSEQLTGKYFSPWCEVWRLWLMVEWIQRDWPIRWTCLCLSALVGGSCMNDSVTLGRSFSVHATYCLKSLRKRTTQVWLNQTRRALR